MSQYIGRRTGLRYYCEICGRILVGEERYRVSLYWKAKPVKWVLYKDIVVCRDCLEKLKSDPEINQYFFIRVKKLDKARITPRGLELKLREYFGRKRQGSFFGDTY